MVGTRVIEVVDHDPAWSASFKEERRRLLAALDGVAVSIEHIGSTAVPGLAAKPIIDLLVEVDQLDRLDRCREALEAIGYSARGENGIPGRRYFTRGKPARTHHLHAFQFGDPHLLRHLEFRDYLVENPAVALAYGALKMRAAAAWRHEPAGYAAAKQDFIAEHQRIARSWDDAPA